MQVLNKFNIDMAKKTAPTVIYAMQNDVNTRTVEIHLFSNSSPWNVPNEITVAVAFQKPDNHKGLYDELPNGDNAITVSGNTITAILAPQVLTCSGQICVAIVLMDENLNRIATFPFFVEAEIDPSSGSDVSNDYYKYSTMEEVSEAVESALSELETSKQDFLDKALEALEVVKDTAKEDSPAIICEETGEIISVSDSSDRTLEGLTLYGKTTQNGTPTPEAPVELVSAGASGAINVFVGMSVDDNEPQTLTASTPNGLPGIPVSSGGNYMDENGQQWICDEIDFVRGVYVKRTVLLDTFTKIREETNTVMYAKASTAALAGGSSRKAICNVLAITKYVFASHDGLHFYADDGKAVVYVPIGFDNSNNTIKVLAALKEPIETALSDEELTAYAALHTNKPNTTVYNDAGAGMAVEYVADTKNYIDQKLAAISAALLNA